MPKGIEIFLVFRQSSDLQTQPNLPVNFTHPQLGSKSFFEVAFSYSCNFIRCSLLLKHPSKLKSSKTVIIIKFHKLRCNLKKDLTPIPTVCKLHD